VSRRLLLVGAGATHLRLLHALAREPGTGLAGAEVALVAPQRRVVPRVALPGLIDGGRGFDAISIELPALAQAAHVALIESRVVALDAAARLATLADGRAAGYDLLSLDPEPATDRHTIPGAREHALALQPLEGFTRLVEGLWDLAARRVLDVVVVGGAETSLDAFELALAIEHRLAGRGEERARVALVTGGSEPLAALPAPMRRLALRRLQRRRITVFRDRCTAIEAAAVVLASGARIGCDAPLLAAAATAPPWLAASGLALAADGWPGRGATLQSASHPEVLVAAGVGPAQGLLANLRHLIAGSPAVPVLQPRQRRPAFVASGGGRAIVGWAGLAAEGRWCGAWKARIDRAELARLGAVSRSAGS
jgi:NADH dehydrogenase FAD-containing subunit